ncbi:MAG: hypothetical protein ACXW27_16015 [Allosphingosinicella sp.]
MTKATLGLTLPVLLLTALPSQAGAQTAVSPAGLCSKNGATPRDFAADARRLSHFVGIHECWQADLADGRQYYLNDLYTRWIVEEVGATAAAMPRDYRAERRSPIARFFVGKTRGTTLSVKIRMRDPDVDFTIPILSLNYDGRRGQGEAFTTLLSRSDMGLPDFRITPTTSASIDASVRSSNEIDVQAAGIVLSTLRDALTIASPGSSLLTSINRDQVQRTSTAYDTALSRLLSTTVAETATTGRLLSEWQPGNAILVSVDIPNSIRTEGTDPTLPRRLWFKISMACPRLSAFDTLNVCEITAPESNQPLLLSSRHFEAAGDNPYRKGEPGIRSSEYFNAVWYMHDRISPHQVLSFRVANGKTLRQFLTEQEWFIAMSKALVTAGSEDSSAAAAVAAESGGAAVPVDPAAAPRASEPSRNISVDPKDDKLRTKIEKASELCEAISEKFYSAGLSRLDANIGVWAAITGMPDFATSRGIFQSSPACREHLPIASSYSPWRFEDTPDPETKAAGAPAATRARLKPKRR